MLKAYIKTAGQSKKNDSLRSLPTF
ncbi:hypothetical protein [Oenococcus oeni]